MGEYESRFAIIGEELKRLNGVLRNKTEQLGIVKQELVQAKNYGLNLKEEKERFQAAVSKLQRENADLRSNLEQFQAKNTEYSNMLRNKDTLIDELQVTNTKI